MADPSFDPARAVRFDLPSGSVRASGDARVALVPVEVLEEIARTPAAEVAGRAMGAAIGKRAASRLGDAGAASVEAFVTQLAGEMAVAGYGVLSVERWGRALVVVVEHCALPEPLLGAVLAAALASA